MIAPMPIQPIENFPIETYYAIFAEVSFREDQSGRFTSGCLLFNDLAADSEIPESFALGMQQIENGEVLDFDAALENPPPDE